MNHRTRRVVVASLAASVAMVSGPQRAEAGEPPEPSSPVRVDGQSAAPVAPASMGSMGSVVVERETLFKLDDDAFDHVERAREFFRKRQSVDAVGHLRRAGWIFGLIERAVRGESPSAATPADVASRFEDLAHACEHHQIEGDRDFDRRLLDIHVALAGMMHERAHAAWSDRREREAGYALRSASRHVEFAAACSGSEMDKDLKARVHGARVAGGKVVGETGWSREEVDRALQALDDGIAWVNLKAGSPSVAPEPAATGTPAGSK